MTDAKFARYALVYQAGIANVFRIGNDLDPHGEDTVVADDQYPTRIRQGAFSSCEDFCAGLVERGAKVYALHCNMAGDVAFQNWSWDLSEAPWNENFRIPRGVVRRKFIRHGEWEARP